MSGTGAHVNRETQNQEVTGFKNYKILVVDDEDPIRQILEIGLKNRGYQVFLAPDYQSAMKIARQQELDFAVVDIRLPDESGTVVCQHLLEIHPDILNVIITGYPDIHTTIQAIRLHAYDYLIKPFRVEQVVSVLERAAAEKELISQRNLNLLKVQELETENARLKKLLSQFMPEEYLNPDDSGSQRKNLEKDAAARKTYGRQNQKMENLLENISKSEKKDRR